MPCLSMRFRSNLTLATVYVMLRLRRKKTRDGKEPSLLGFSSVRVLRLSEFGSGSSIVWFGSVINQKITFSCNSSTADGI